MKQCSICLWITLIALLFLASCNRGKRMPKTVYVEINTEKTNITIGNGAVSYPYTSVLDGDYQLNTVTEKLTRYLKRNNIKTRKGQHSDYRIELTSINIGESLGSSSYTDTCDFPIREKDIIFSKVNYQVNVAIINMENMVVIDNLSTTITRDQKVNCDEYCGEPILAKIEITDMIKDLTKELRKKIANVIYIDQGF